MENKFLGLGKAYYNALKINRAGLRIKKKYLIIESDDWGAIRTPSNMAINAFREKGMEIEKSLYQFDALESDSDLNELFNLLLEFKDCKGKPLKLTTNTIVGNPDFEKIKESNYTSYFYESFVDTYKRYPSHSKAFEIIKSGIDKEVVRPQFHGREHLNIKRWFHSLNSGNEFTRFSFDWGSTYSGKGDYSFMEAFDWDNKSDIIFQNQILREGFQLFENIFDFPSKSFIAPCYNWDPEIETELKDNGVSIIQSLKKQYIPTGKFESYTSLPHHFGELNSLGLRYNIRNCFLEPSLGQGIDWVDRCMAQIQTAFFFKKPAVICSHRINYIGFIDINNRDRGLSTLRKLMKRVMLKWPDVQFISTDQLGDLLTNK